MDVSLLLNSSDDEARTHELDERQGSFHDSPSQFSSQTQRGGELLERRASMAQVSLVLIPFRMARRIHQPKPYGLNSIGIA